MTKVIVGEDCGNSPKNLLLEKLTIAFATGESEFILNSITDDIRLNLVGREAIQGREDFTRALERITDDEVVELTIRHVVTHGKAGAVDGRRLLKNGKIYAFCDVYEFKGAKGTHISEMTSYVVELTT